MGNPAPRAITHYACPDDGKRDVIIWMTVDGRSRPFCDEPDCVRQLEPVIGPRTPKKRAGTFCWKKSEKGYR